MPISTYPSHRLLAYHAPAVRAPSASPPQASRTSLYPRRTPESAQAALQWVNQKIANSIRPRANAQIIALPQRLLFS